MDKDRHLAGNIEILLDRADDLPCVIRRYVRFRTEQEPDVPGGKRKMVPRLPAGKSVQPLK